MGRLNTIVQLRERLDKVIERHTWFKIEVIGISGLIILVVVYLFAGFDYSMKRGIQQINTTLAAIAQGDLVHIAYSRAPTEAPKDRL